MATKIPTAFESRFRAPAALAAARKFVDEAVSTGLKIRSLNSFLTALEFDDANGDAPFSAIANNAHVLLYLRGPALKRDPTLFRKATAVFGPVKPNKRGEYRWRVKDTASLDRILEWMRKEAIWPWRPNEPLRLTATAPTGRLPAEQLNRVSTADILEAARDLSRGFVEHDFSEATRYEVLFEGHRLKPKAIFGVAATRALRFRVRPSHFSGGLNTICFRKIAAAGLPITEIGSVAATKPPARRESLKAPTEFEVGKAFSREEIANAIGMPKARQKGNWLTGYDSYNGEYFVFCTVGMRGRTGPDYANRWHDGKLIWSAKSGTRLGQDEIEAIISGRIPVHVFWRGKNRARFTYAGVGVAVDVEDSTPVEVTWLFGAPLGSQDLIDQPIWRRGPPPSIGERAIFKQDGPTSVYLMILNGATPATFPKLANGSKLAKIGMSNDPARRLIELNSGIPPGCILQWIFVRAREYPSGPEAYLAEGALLEGFRDAGRWLGGEFVSVTNEEAETLLA